MEYLKFFLFVMIDIKFHTFSEPQPWADLNEIGNFRNGENVGNDRNVMNVMTDIKCLTFSETQAQGGLNDDGNFRKCWVFQECRECKECWEQNRMTDISV